MITQQINLFRLLPKKTGMYLTRGVVLGSYGLLVFFILLLSIINLWQKNKLSFQLGNLKEESVWVEQQLAELTKKYPISDPYTLQTSIKDLKDQIVHTSQAINLLSLNIFFSKYLYTIASSTVEGTWLKEITVDRASNQMILKGATLQRRSLDDFLNHLQKQAYFLGKIFNLQELTETSNPAVFTIVTQQAALI